MNTITNLMLLPKKARDERNLPLRPSACLIPKFTQNSCVAVLSLSCLPFAKNAPLLLARNSHRAKTFDIYKDGHSPCERSVCNLMLVRVCGAKLSSFATL